MLMTARYICPFDSKRIPYIIEFIPYTGTDRVTGHTVNIYGNVTEELKREIYLSSQFRRTCPRDAYFLEEEKEILPIIKEFPLYRCKIYKQLKGI